MRCAARDLAGRAQFKPVERGSMGKARFVVCAEFGAKGLGARGKSFWPKLGEKATPLPAGSGVLGTGD